MLLLDKPRTIEGMKGGHPLAKGLVCALPMIEPSCAVRNLVYPDLFVGSARTANGLVASVAAQAHRPWMSMTSGGYSFCMWHGGMPLGDWQSIYSCGAADYYILQRYSSNSYMRLYHDGGSSNWPGLTTSDVASEQMLVITWDNGPAKAYINAVYDSDCERYVSPPAGANTLSFYGGATCKHYMIMAYNRALSQEEIELLYRRPWDAYEIPRGRGMIALFTGGLVIERTVSDGIGVTDARATAKAFVRTLTESIGVADAETRAAIFGRTQNDGLGIQDSTLRVAASVRTLADALGVTDQQIKDQEKTIGDAMGLTDEALRTCLLLRTVAETLGATDTTSYSLGLQRVIADSLGIVDAVTELQVTLRLVLDSVGITDATLRTQTVARIISENLGLTDVMMQGRWETISDAIGLTDELTRLIDFVRAELETLGLIDSTMKTAGTVRTVADDMTIGDTIIKVMLALRTVSDDVGMTDQMSGDLNAVIKAAWAFLLLQHSD